MRVCFAVAAAVAAATVGLASADSARGTTVPGLVYVSNLVISDNAVKVRVRHNTWAETIRYRRGAEVRYVVVNRGSRAYSLDILGSVTGMLRPGKRTTMLVSWSRRGSFVFRASPRGARLRVVVT